MRNPFRRIIVQEVRICGYCGDKEERVYTTSPFVMRFKSGLFTVACAGALPGMFGMIVAVMIAGGCVWCVRSILQMKNLLPELKRRALSPDAKLW